MLHFSQLKIFELVLLIAISQSSLAQFKLTKLDSNTIPSTIHYNGHIKYAVRWTDSLGENIVITTATDQTKTEHAADDSYLDAALYAWHYLVQNDSCKQLWQVYDFVKECPVDIDLYFVNKTFAVTDLNKNGIAEVWLMYKNSCHGDVSPVPMKIIMYEGSKKYAARGTTEVKVSATAYDGGDYTYDDNFKNAPPAFKRYADELWKQHKIENWQQ